MDGTVNQPLDLSRPPVMRSLLLQLLRHTELAGFDRRGRAVVPITTNVPVWRLDRMLVFGAEDENLEDADPVEDAKGG